MVRTFSAAEMTAILAACLVAALALFHGASREFWLLLAVGVVTVQVIWIVVQDIADFTIPDGAVAAIAVAGTVVRFGIAEGSSEFECLSLLLDASLCGLAFLAIREAFFRLKGFDGMGFGDVKLAVASGVLVGAENFAWSVFAASALGLVIALVAWFIRPKRKIERLPFGALLAPACWAIWVMQLWSVA